MYVVVVGTCGVDGWAACAPQKLHLTIDDNLDEKNYLASISHIMTINSAHP